MTDTDDATPPASRREARDAEEAADLAKRTPAPKMNSYVPAPQPKDDRLSFISKMRADREDASDSIAEQEPAEQPAQTELAAFELLLTPPVETELLTTEPARTELLTTEPARTELLTTEPAPTELLTTEPAPTELLLTEPAATELIRTSGPISPAAPTASDETPTQRLAVDGAAPFWASLARERDDTEEGSGGANIAGASNGGANSAGAGKGGGTRGGGFLGSFGEHPKSWLYSALAVVFILLGTGAVFAGRATGTTQPTAAISASTSASAKPSTSPTPTARATPASIAAATKIRTCSVATAAADARLGTFDGTVINTVSGEVLFDRNGTTATPPASVMKTLTSAAALATVGTDYRFTTKVFAGTEPGSIVLVGGGDPTLSAVDSSVYKGAPKLSDLASQVEAAWTKLHPDPSVDGGTITSVILDATLWNPADNWDPSWPANERTLGYQPLITALMVDGDRANPSAQDSPRSTDPVGAAGAAFVKALGLPDATTVTRAAATSTAVPLGQVQSQPIGTLIGQMLPVSDNTLAEMMARLVSKTTGGDGSQASLNTKIPAALAKYGIPTTGMTVKDGSGESNLNGIPTSYAAQLMVKILAGGQDLGVIYSALPVAGKTGTLASRFTGANAVARGNVNAKTGSIANLYALSGIVHAADGTPLAFAFYAGGKVTGSGAIGGLDTITAAVYKCGNNLSNS